MKIIHYSLWEREDRARYKYAKGVFCNKEVDDPDASSTNISEVTCQDCLEQLLKWLQAGMDEDKRELEQIKASMHKTLSKIEAVKERQKII